MRPVTAGRSFNGMVEILEQGIVSFLAEARPGVVAPWRSADVERLFLVLAPGGRRPLRRLSVRRRRLPARARGQRFYAHVDRIASAPAGLTEDLRPRPAAGARVLAVGRYTLARHRDHVHLAYALSRACGRGPLARAVGIGQGASYVLCVLRRSPPATRRPGDEEPLEPATPARLDVLGAEVALVGGERPRDGALGIPPRVNDRVGDALVGALLRRGPRPRVASLSRSAELRGRTRRTARTREAVGARARAASRGRP